MLFLIKKIVSLTLMPLSISLIVGILGLFMLYSKHYGRAKKLLSLSFLWLFLFSYAPVSNAMLYGIEKEYPSLLAAPGDTKYIYVLGSGHKSDESRTITSQLSREAVVRLSEGIRLYRQLSGKARLITSGFSGLSDPVPQAVMMKRLAISLGIPPDDILTTPSAKDTEDEAKEALRITKGAPMILVTSAYHMPRAMAWFKSVGLSPLPAPTYFRSDPRGAKWSQMFSVSALEGSTMAFHEYLGSIWQHLKSALR